jgi:4'-phosphopantetheinyl transferase
VNENEVHLWHARVPPSSFDELLGRVRLVLTPAEIVRATRFRFDAHRVLYAFSHALLRTLLTRYLGREPMIVETTSGKPELSDPALRFNLSHTEGHVLIGVTREADLGVDIENNDARNDENVARMVFTPEELRTPMDFCERWTLKESFAKARGEGLSIDLKRFAFTPRFSCEFDDAEAWSFYTFKPEEECCASAAVRMVNPKWILRSLSP